MQSDDDIADSTGVSAGTAGPTLLVRGLSWDDERQVASVHVLGGKFSTTVDMECIGRLKGGWTGWKFPAPVTRVRVAPQSVDCLISYADEEPRDETLTRRCRILEVVQAEYAFDVIEPFPLEASVPFFLSDDPGARPRSVEVCMRVHLQSYADSPDVQASVQDWREVNARVKEDLDRAAREAGLSGPREEVTKGLEELYERELEVARGLGPEVGVALPMALRSGEQEIPCVFEICEKLGNSNEFAGRLHLSDEPQGLQSGCELHRVVEIPSGKEFSAHVGTIV